MALIDIIVWKLKVMILQGAELFNFDDFIVKCQFTLTGFEKIVVVQAIFFYYFFFVVSVSVKAHNKAFHLLAV